MSSHMEVRRLSAADAERMRDIAAILPVPEWRDELVPGLRHLATALADPSVYVFAAFEGERPAGFVSAYRFPSLTKECNLVYIYDVYVAPDDQARGVGRQLMDSVIAQCRSDGVTEAWVATDVDNPAAHRLYDASGASGHMQYVQFEFDLATPREEET